MSNYYEEIIKKLSTVLNKFFGIKNPSPFVFN